MVRSGEGMSRVDSKWHVTQGLILASWGRLMPFDYTFSTVFTVAWV